jgi:phage tail tube protein FII
MHPDNVKLAQGTVYINGQEFVGNVTDYNYEDYAEATDEYLKENMVARLNGSGELSFTFKVKRSVIYKIMGVWDWVRENCPNRRVKHLMKYGKNERVRFKNFNRACHLVGMMLEEK